MSAILPAASVLIAVLCAAVPWGLPIDATFILPLLVVMMVFCWRVLQEQLMPPVAAMLLGLLTDVTTASPLGFWGLLALIAASAGSRARTLTGQRGVGVLWLVWIPLVILLAGSGWLLASFYFFRWVDWHPIAIGAAASIPLFPPVFSLLLEIDRAWVSPRSGNAYGGAV